jgi:hypothetical protein
MYEYNDGQLTEAVYTASYRNCVVCIYVQVSSDTFVSAFKAVLCASLSNRVGGRAETREGTGRRGLAVTMQIIFLRYFYLLFKL